MPRIVIVGAGLSGLATAHYLTTRLQAAGRSAEVRVLESEPVPGGKMRTISDGGFNLEWGPNGFLTNKPYGLELCAEIGISDRLARSSDLARKRFIYAGGALHKLPESPPAFLRSKLVSLGGKLRLLGEPFAKKAPVGVDESLADFARRRLGPQALARLIDPMVTGIFAGDPERMSVAASFPRVHELEQQYGGLVKGMLALRREKKKQAKLDGQQADTAMTAGPSGVLMSFDRGVGVLAEALAARAGAALELGVSVEKLERRAGGGYLLSTRKAGALSTLEADVVVLATPAYAAASLLGPLDGELAESLQAIPYSPISVTAVGYDRATFGNPLDGFGFIVPGGEGRRILGGLWDSSVFPNRAPDGKVLLRVLVGGARRPELAGLPEDELIKMVRDELREIMGVTAEPVLARRFFHERGIPQYIVGHPARLAQLDGRIASLPGVHLNSNAYRGVALNDCVLQSRLCAERIVAALA